MENIKMFVKSKIHYGILNIGEYYEVVEMVQNQDNKCFVIVGPNQKLYIFNIEDFEIKN